MSKAKTIVSTSDVGMSVDLPDRIRKLDRLKGPSKGVKNRHPPDGADTSGVVSSRAHSILSYFSFQPVIHDWCNKDRGMCNPVCGMVHIKELLLLFGKSSPCGGSGFPSSLTI